MYNTYPKEWTIYPEDIAVAELLNSSKEFQAFYRSERGKITIRITWAKDPTLPEGIDSGINQLNPHESVIRLRRVPALVQDAYRAAHELEHAVFDEQGYPTLAAISHQFENLAASLTSMVADPLVDTELDRFGFDIRKGYEEETADSIRQLEAMPSPSTGRFDEFLWMVNYASKVLDWELRKGSDTKSKFQLWFDARYPRVAERAQKLVARVKRIGYSTPAKQRTLFSEIIRRYDLGSVLWLPPQASLDR